MDYLEDLLIVERQINRAEQILTGIDELQDKHTENQLQIVLAEVANLRKLHDRAIESYRTLLEEERDKNTNTR